MSRRVTVIMATTDRRADGSALTVETLQDMGRQMLQMAVDLPDGNRGVVTDTRVEARRGGGAKLIAKVAPLAGEAYEDEVVHVGVHGLCDSPTCLSCHCVDGRIEALEAALRAVYQQQDICHGCWKQAPEEERAEHEPVLRKLGLIE